MVVYMELIIGNRMLLLRKKNGSQQLTEEDVEMEGERCRLGKRVKTRFLRSFWDLVKKIENESDIETEKNS